MLAAAMPDPDHKDTKAKSKAILDNGPTATVFFSAAERALAELMQRIVAGNGDATYQYWTGTLRTAALDAWGATCRTLGNAPIAMRAQARAYPRFWGLLHTLELPETDDPRQEVNA